MSKEELDKLSAEEQEQRPATNRAGRARNIIEDELVVNAFAGMEKSFQAAIRTSEAGQSALREDCYRMLRLLDMFKSAFDKHLDDGKVADAVLKDIGARRKTIRERMAQWRNAS